MAKGSNIGFAIIGALLVLFFYFAGFILAIKAHYNKTLGEGYIVWSIFSLLSAVFFGYMALSLIVTSSPSNDVFWYYIGWSAIVLNGIGVLIVFYNFIRTEK
jgi:hypothetical protein